MCTLHFHAAKSSARRPRARSRWKAGDRWTCAVWGTRWCQASKRTSILGKGCAPSRCRTLLKGRLSKGGTRRRGLAESEGRGHTCTPFRLPACRRIFEAFERRLGAAALTLRGRIPFVRIRLHSERSGVGQGGCGRVERTGAPVDHGIISVRVETSVVQVEDQVIPEAIRPAVCG